MSVGCGKNPLQFSLYVIKLLVTIIFVIYSRTWDNSIYCNGSKEMSGKNKTKKNIIIGSDFVDTDTANLSEW